MTVPFLMLLVGSASLTVTTTVSAAGRLGLRVTDAPAKKSILLADGPLENLHHAPVLQLGQGARLLDDDEVSGAAGVPLVVGHESAGEGHGLLVQRMGL